MSRLSPDLYGASIANFTVAFTTDNPAITANSTLTIADGDAATVTRAEYNELAVETATKINTMLDAMRYSGMIYSTGTTRTGSTVSAATAVADLTVDFTTDNPAITANSTLTIADGDAASVTRAEYNELAVETASKLNAILAALRATGIIAS